MNNKTKDIKPIKEIETEKEIYYICKIDNNSKIAIGMSNNYLSIYNLDLSIKLITINEQPSYFFTELSGRTFRNGIKLLCCSYSYQIKVLELIFKDNNKVEYSLLYTIEPNESRNEINKAIELNNKEKNIVSIDEQNIIIYKLVNEVNYFETKKISAEGANDILNINDNIFCISLKNKGILQFYENNNFELINQIKNIESYGSNNYICKLNEDILCIGGFEYISLIDIDFKQLNNKIELFKNKERITSTCGIIEKRLLITGTKYKNIELDEFFFDIIVYKLNEDNVLIEIKRFISAHDKIINSIIYNDGNIISVSEDKKIKVWNLSEL